MGAMAGAMPGLIPEWLEKVRRNADQDQQSAGTRAGAGGHRTAARACAAAELDELLDGVGRPRRPMMPWGLSWVPAGRGGPGHAFEKVQ